MNTDMESQYTPEAQQRKAPKWPVVVSAILGIIAGAGIAIFGVIFYFMHTQSAITNSSESVISSVIEDADSSDDSKLQMLIYLIEEYYYQDVDDQTLIDGIYSGLIESLGDPYSQYYNAEE